jgi:hypothetical protein
MASPTAKGDFQGNDLELATDVIARNNALVADRQSWDSVIQQITNYVMPRKNQVNTKTNQPDTASGVDLYDTTAVDANMVLGAGQLQYITPANERWAGFEAPEQLRTAAGEGKSRLDLWYRECSERAMTALAQCNFYSEVHEFYLDRGGVGTACLSAMPGRRESLNVTCHAYGTYAIGEDDEGHVDTVFRSWAMSARVAVKKFGLERMGKKVREAYNAKDSKQRDKKFNFIHAVYPREEDKRKPGKVDGPNKPVASVYVCVDDKHVVSNEGFDEMPYQVSRYLTHGEDVYGYSPSVDILATIRQVNLIEKQMDALAEKAAFPPVLYPESMTGAIDLRAAGMTPFDPNQPNALPKEWGTQGRYDIGLERVKTKQDAIRRAYHNDLFNMFAGVEREITAYQTMQMVAEKLVLFSPTFARLTTEFLNPFLQRVFGILFRAGVFSEPPPEAYVEDGRGGSSLVVPTVVYTSKVALAIKALENQSWLEFINLIMPLVELRPEIMDNFDVDKIAIGLAKNVALASGWQIDPKTRDATRAARAEQLAAQQQLGAAESLSKSAANMGKAPPGMRAEVSAALGRN